MPPPLLRNVIRGRNKIGFRVFLAAAGRPGCPVSALRGHEDVLRRIRRHLAPKWYETMYAVASDFSDGRGGELEVHALHLRGFDLYSSYNTPADERLEQDAVSSDGEGDGSPTLGEPGNEGSGSLIGTESEALMWTSHAIGRMDHAIEDIYDWISEQSSVDLTDADGELLAEVELRSRFSERRDNFCGTRMLEGDTVFWFFGQWEQRFFDRFEPATLEELVERGLVDETGNGILRRTATEVLGERAAEYEVYGSLSE